MFQAFYPKEYVDSTYEIDFEGLYRRGYRGILFDVDNTLVPQDVYKRQMLCTVLCRTGVPLPCLLKTTR